MMKHHAILTLLVVAAALYAQDDQDAGDEVEAVLRDAERAIARCKYAAE